MNHSHRTPFLQSSIAGTSRHGLLPRAFRLLLLLVLALTVVEYLFGSILDATQLRTYLYASKHNATPTIKNEKLPWPKNKITPTAIQNPMKNSTSSSNNISIKETLNMTHNNINNISEDTSTPLLITKAMEGINNHSITELDFRDKPSMPMCDEEPPDLDVHLSPMAAKKTEIKLDWVEKRFPDVRSGGLYSPPNCTARHRVAIIVPYGNRENHLPTFLNHMHPFLMKQQIEYGIYIVEQAGVSKFNRAKLMNVGFIESLKQRSWQCFIFHDIDLLPLDSRNLYSCPRQPRHMSVSVDKFDFRLPYEDIIGGVLAMTKEQFSRVNGFSNKYWGWGGEDDDMFYRLRKKNYHIARYKMSIARYAMLDHTKSIPNPRRFALLWAARRSFKNDGLSTLKYKLLKVTFHHLYMHILVNIKESSRSNCAADPSRINYMCALFFCIIFVLSK